MADGSTSISQSRIDHAVLNRVLAVARRLGASADLHEILSLIIDAMRDTLSAERATVFEYDAKTHELFTTVAHGVATENGAMMASSDENRAASVREIRIPASSGLAGECAQTRQIINVQDAYADSRFNKAIDVKTGFRTRSILTIPLLGHDGELVGVAQVLNKGAESFDAADEQIAEALAAHAAVAMRRGRLIEDRLVRQKLERDLELARTIQQGTLPASLPKLDHFEIAAWNQPAEETGGDTYDVIERGDGRIVLLMADATGHGVGPALSVTQLRSMVRMAIRMGATLPDIVDFANQQLCGDLPAGRFITAWFGELDAQNGNLQSISAGQAPLIHFHADRNEFEILDATTVPLGVLDEIDLGNPSSRSLKPGDFFAVISDGIIEAMNNTRAQFGLERVQKHMLGANAKGAAAMINSLQIALREFTGASENQTAGSLHDDCTAIIILRRAAQGGCA